MSDRWQDILQPWLGMEVDVAVQGRSSVGFSGPGLLTAVNDDHLLLRRYTWFGHIRFEISLDRVVEVYPSDKGSYDWKKRRMLSSADLDPNRGRIDPDKWTSMGAVERARAFLRRDLGPQHARSLAFRVIEEMAEEGVAGDADTTT